MHDLNTFANFSGERLVGTKKNTVAHAIAMPLPLCFSFFVLLRYFLKYLIKPFYFYLSRTYASVSGTPPVINVILINF